MRNCTKSLYNSNDATETAKSTTNQFHIDQSCKNTRASSTFIDKQICVNAWDYLRRKNVTGIKDGIVQEGAIANKWNKIFIGKDVCSMFSDSTNQ